MIAHLQGQLPETVDVAELVHFAGHFAFTQIEISGGRLSCLQRMDLIARIRAACPEETVAVISGDLQRWFSLTRDRALAPVGPRQNGVVDPGLYVLGARAGKGLEFDTVIVDCARIFEPEEETLQRLLYVNCTRARKRLYLRYAGEPPEILQRFYSDFLS